MMQPNDIKHDNEEKLTAPDHPSDHALGLDVSDNEVVIESVDFEREARRQGWVPQDSFRGDDLDWVDAQTFVQRGREINPILRANNDRLKVQLDSLQNQNNVLVQELTELKKGQSVIQKRDYDTTLGMLKSARLEAMEGGDHEKFFMLDEQIDQLRGQREQLVPQVRETPQQSSAPDPEFQAWHRENPWYGVDEWRTVTTNKIAEETRHSYPQLIGRKFLDEVVLEAQTRYPRDFGLAVKERPSNAMRHSMVDENNGRRPVVSESRNRYSTADLPGDARAAMQKFVKDGLMTEKRYVELYFSGEQS